MRIFDFIGIQAEMTGMSMVSNEVVIGEKKI